jgi:phage recombination protein Bet
MTTDIQTLGLPRPGLIEQMAHRFGIAPGKLLPTLKATAFRTEKEATDAQMMALLIVANEYKLNPFTKEIYAFPDKRGGIVPVVSVDGWARIINEHPQFNGCELAWDEADESYTCTVFRKDRDYPVRITEYMQECARGTDPWKTHPRRMLRHKAFIQGARLAFGFAGIYDNDEADAILSGPAPAPAPAHSLRARRAVEPVPMVDEVQPEATPTPEPEPSPALAELLAQLHALAGDPDGAAAVLDLGRNLPEPERNALVLAYQQQCKD